jgi:hypothetical protein
MGQFCWFWPVWSENQKQQIQICAQLLEVTGQEKKVGAPDTHARLVRGQSRSVQENLRALSREEVTGQNNKKNLHAHPCCWPNKRFSTRMSSCKAKRTKNLRARQGGSDQTLHAKKRFCMHTRPDKAWLHAKENCARRRGGDSTGKMKKPLHAQPKKIFLGAREVTGQGQRSLQKNTLRAIGRKWPVRGASSCKKKSPARAAGEETGRCWALQKNRSGARWAAAKNKKNGLRAREVTGQRNAARQKKKVQRDKNCRWQLTDLREQACAVRTGRDRFNRSTKAVQPLLTRMVLVKTG